MADTDLRYVWRHLPLTDVHPQAQLAAEAAEAAAVQGRFWGMHDLLRYADRLGLDTDRFHDELMAHAYRDRIAGELSGFRAPPRSSSTATANTALTTPRRCAKP